MRAIGNKKAVATDSLVTTLAAAMSENGNINTQSKERKSSSEGLALVFFENDEGWEQVRRAKGPKSFRRRYPHGNDRISKDHRMADEKIKARMLESTIATALRDIQWLASDGIHMPDAFAVLGGNVESTFSDVALQHGHRFFLFELKSSRTDIATEWQQGRQTEVSDSTSIIEASAPKPIHDRSIALTQAVIAGDVGENDHFLRSLRAHHFVFWDPAAVTEDDPLSGLVLSPYILGTIRRLSTAKASTLPLAHGVHRDAAVDLMEKIAERVALQYGHPFHHPTKVKTGTEVPYSAIYTEAAAVTSCHPDWRQSSSLGPLGLTQAEFQIYTQEVLSRGSGSEQINAIAWGSNGLYRVVKNLSDLGDLGASPAPEASPRPPLLRLRGLRRHLQTLRPKPHTPAVQPPPPSMRRRGPGQP